MWLIGDLFVPQVPAKVHITHVGVWVQLAVCLILSLCVVLLCVCVVKTSLPLSLSHPLSRFPSFQVVGLGQVRRFVVNAPTNTDPCTQTYVNSVWVVVVSWGLLFLSQISTIISVLWVARMFRIVDFPAPSIEQVKKVWHAWSFVATCHDPAFALSHLCRFSLSQSFTSSISSLVLAAQRNLSELQHSSCKLSLWTNNSLPTFPVFLCSQF